MHTDLDAGHVICVFQVLVFNFVLFLHLSRGNDRCSLGSVVRVSVTCLIADKRCHLPDRRPHADPGSVLSHLGRRLPLVPFSVSDISIVSLTVYGPLLRRCDFCRPFSSMVC